MVLLIFFHRLLWNRVITPFFVLIVQDELFRVFMARSAQYTLHHMIRVPTETGKPGK